jgi:Tol biopolymer transport system component
MVAPGGPYLAQEPPGVTPKVFAPGIVSLDSTFEFGCTITPDGREVFFTRREPGSYNHLLWSRQDSAGWSVPVRPSFAIQFGEFEPCLTPDGTGLFYSSVRPVDGDTNTDFRPAVWSVRRDEGGWTEPEFFDTGINHLTVAENGDMYYSGRLGGREEVSIAHRRKMSQGWTDEEDLSKKYDWFLNAYQPAIAPDGAYLVFVRRDTENESGNLDLWVSHVTESGEWSDPVRLNDSINSQLSESAPSISADGKYLFFTRADGDLGDIWWVATEGIASSAAK